MGLFKMSCGIPITGPEMNTSPNPNKYNFNILYGEDVDTNCWVVLEYPDCTQGERFKVCVFKATSILALRRMNSIDPHFVNKRLYARIRFTDDGSHVNIAREIARMI